MRRITALLITLFIGPYVIQKLREFQIGQYMRDDGPKVAPEKGGNADNGRRAHLHCDSAADGAVVGPGESVCLGCGVVDAGFGAIGFADDYIKVVKRRSLGLTARAKMFLQRLAGVAVAVALVVLRAAGLCFRPG